MINADDTFITMHGSLV